MKSKIVSFFKRYKKILTLISILLLTLAIFEYINITFNSITFNNIESMKKNYKVDNEVAENKVKDNVNGMRSRNESNINSNEKLFVSRHDKI